MTAERLIRGRCPICRYTAVIGTATFPGACGACYSRALSAGERRPKPVLLEAV